MIARGIVVSFYIFGLLNYHRIFGRNLGHDPPFCRGSGLGLAPEIYVSYRFLSNIEVTMKLKL